MYWNIFVFLQIYLYSLLVGYVYVKAKKDGLSPPFRFYTYRFYDAYHYLYKKSRLKQHKWLYKWLVVLSAMDRVVIIFGATMFLAIIGTTIIQLLTYLVLKNYIPIRDIMDSRTLMVSTYIYYFSIISSLLIIYINKRFNSKGFKPIVPFMFIRNTDYKKQISSIVNLTKYKVLKKWVVLLKVMDILIIILFVYLFGYIVHKTVYLASATP